MTVPMFPDADLINHLLAELRSALKAEGESVDGSSVPSILHELSVVLGRLGPAGRGTKSVTGDDRIVFALWEQAMAEALGLSRADAHRIVGRVVRGRVGAGDDVDVDSLPRLIDEVAHSWGLLSPVERRTVAREIRDASQTRMLGFANGFLQNEQDQFPLDWLALREALFRCLVMRAVEVIPDSASAGDAARRILGPFSEESMFGARVWVEHHIRGIGKVLARLGQGMAGRPSSGGGAR